MGRYLTTGTWNGASQAAITRSLTRPQTRRFWGKRHRMSRIRAYRGIWRTFRCCRTRGRPPNSHERPAPTRTHYNHKKERTRSDSINPRSPITPILNPKSKPARLLMCWASQKSGTSAGVSSSCKRQRATTVTIAIWCRKTPAKTMWRIAITLIIRSLRRWPATSALTMTESWKSTVKYST